MSIDLNFGGAMPVLRPETVAAWLGTTRARAPENVPVVARPRAAAPRFGPASLAATVAVAITVWLTTGIARVEPDELGIVTRFGRYVGTRSSGLNYHWPYPFERERMPKVTQVNQVAIGSGGGTTTQMLTGDENLVEANAAVFWRVKDPLAFVFNVVDPEATVRVAADAAVRTVIGRNPIQAALSDRRQAIADEAQALLQTRLDAYQTGIQITQVQLQRVDPPVAVIDAFNDVQRARADQERARNEAEAYRNDILPRARGEAEHIRQEAQAFREQAVNLAQGEAGQFTAMAGSYGKARELTGRRLYLEAMEEVLRSANKIMVDTSAPGIVPYLPLPALHAPALPAPVASVP